MPEELKELWDEDVQRPVQHVAVQDLGRILTDLLQGPERALTTPTCSTRDGQITATRALTSGGRCPPLCDWSVTFYKIRDQGQTFHLEIINRIERYSMLT